jgi:SAM-dependent MidA family methyltransferase
VTLRRNIEQEIRERGPMPFSRYMELCLYDPELGYYSRNAEQFGKAGDFYTSSDVHAVFGRLLARQFDEMWRALGAPDRIEILELGPGRGLFAQDVLDWSEKKFPEFFRALHYSLAERSPALQERLGQTVSRFLDSGKASLVSRNALQDLHVPQGLKPSSFLAMGGTAEAVPFHGAAGHMPGAPEVSLADRKDSGCAENGKGTTSVVRQGGRIGRALAPEVPIIVFANEFFDALPVEVLSPQGRLLIEARDGRFTETWAPPSAEELEFLDRYSMHPESGERVEVPLTAQGYMSQLTAAVERGFIVAIDYGYTRQEQLSGRHRGTVTAYRQHSVSANPYEAPGEQDITAHVNFTALAAAAEQNGMQTYPLLTQSQFLMGIGEKNQFADAFEECRLPQERAKVALQLKHLVTPAGMGENFHVLLASKGIDNKQVARLSGLSFGKGKPLGPP